MQSRIGVFLIPYAVASVMALPLSAQEAAQPKDIAAVEACLQLVKKNQAARPMHGIDETEEQAGPEGRLNAARDAALRNAESCIGVAATACIQAGGGIGNPVLRDCYERETKVWDGRLNAAFKKLLAQTETFLKETDRAKDVAEVVGGYRQIQRVWIAYRDATCRQPGLYFGGGADAAVMSIRCTLEMTGRQAVWVGSRVEAPERESVPSPK
jgi:uncharacterized protein YecT (DUF1311 family)